MAIIKAVNSKASIGKGINYITNKEKTEERLIAGKDCNPETAIDEMKAIKELYNKTDGRQYKHYVMSFNPNDPEMNIEKAHEVGKKFMENEEKFKNHQVIMATHIDKGHIHNHFIVNSVNMENGKKYRESKKDLEKLKDHLRKLEKEYNIMRDDKSREQGKIVINNQAKYQAIKRDFEGNYKSYVLETANAVKNAQEKAISKEDFIKKMEQQGYQTNWKETSKHITFINKETTKRVRLANLEKTFNDKDFSKEGLNREFERNKERESQRTRQIDRETGETIDWRKIERELGGDRARNNIGSEKSRISKQPSNAISNKIQRETNRVREEVQRATGKAKPTIGENSREQQPIKSRPTRSFEHER